MQRSRNIRNSRVGAARPSASLAPSGRQPVSVLLAVALLIAGAAFSSASAAASPTGVDALTSAASAGAGASDSPSATASRRKAGRRWKRDYDGDGIPNWRDRDMDGDRVSNKHDRDIDGDRVRNTRDRDIDGDRRKNGRDREIDSDGLRNSRDRDIDADRLRNCPRDRDMDADRIPNSRDRDMDADGLPNARDPDIDSDGRPNARDSDMDCDGVPNRFDPDIDGDGLLNYLDPDSDADGIAVDGSIPAGVHLPKAFFGIVAVHPFAVEGAPRYVQLSQIGTTSVGTLRHVFEWADIETAPGVYDFDVYDSYVADTARFGFTLLPILFNPPSFRSSRPATGANRGTYPPSNNGDFGAFAARLVARYGPNGRFWAEHPNIPRHPIRSWQVWNEPHINVFWPTGPDPAAYTAMLRTVGAYIKAADPGAEVVSAAISESNLGVPVLTYIQGMYNAGARGSFDSLAVNPYAAGADQVYEILLNVRRLANANGDAGTPIRVTELGWATGGPESPFRVTYAGQAELIVRTWAALVRHRDDLGLRGLIYFNWRDLAPYLSPFQDYFGLHTGLLELNGAPKPGAYAFAAAVRAMTAP